MSQTVNFSVRMDSALKQQCESLYNELGMNLTTAINVFLRQSLRYGGFPFAVRLSEAERDLSYTTPNKTSRTGVYQCSGGLTVLESTLVSISPPTTDCTSSCT